MILEEYNKLTGKIIRELKDVESVTNIPMNRKRVWFKKRGSCRIKASHKLIATQTTKYTHKI